MLLLRQRHVVRHRLDPLVAEHHLQSRFGPVAGQLDGDSVFPVGKASEVHVGDAKGDHVLVVFVGRNVAGDRMGGFQMPARGPTTSCQIGGREAREGATGRRERRLRRALRLGLLTVPAVAMPLQIDRAPEAVLQRRPPYDAELAIRACVRMIERYVIGIEAS